MANYNNNTRERKSTNTNGVQLYNSDGAHKSTLQYNFWDKYISFKINPALSADKMTQTERFDYDQVVMTSISPVKALILVKKIDALIEGKYLESGEKFCAGVPVNQNGGVFIGVDKIEGIEVAYAYLLITKDIDPQTRVPKTAMYYQFNQEIVIDSYDIETGEADVSNDPYAELRLIRNLLEQDALQLIGSSAHAMRHVDKYYRDQLAEAAGVKKGSGSGHSYNNTGSVFGSGNTSSPKVDRDQLDNVEEMGSFADMS